MKVNKKTNTVKEIMMNLEKEKDKIGPFPNTREMFEEYLKQQNTKDAEPALLKVLNDQSNMGLLEIMYYLGGD